MPIGKIVSIQYMAQAIISIVLLKPDSARARPSTLINSDSDYRTIFSLDTPIDVYLKTIQVMKAVEAYLKPSNTTHTLERKVITNIKHYVAMVVGIRLAGQKTEIVSKFAELPSISIPEKILADSVTLVIAEFTGLGSTDQVAKGSILTQKILARI